jgi:hypothetical protein
LKRDAHKFDLRVGDVLEDIEDTRQAINDTHSNTGLEYLFSVAEPFANAVSDALDFVVLIGVVFKRPKLSTWADYWCSALWLFAIIFEVRRSLQNITAKLDATEITSEDRRKFYTRRFFRGYVALLKGICDTILGLSSISAKIDNMTTLVNVSGLGGGLTGLAISLSKKS